MQLPADGFVGALGIGAKLLIAFNVLTACLILMHTFICGMAVALGIDERVSDALLAQMAAWNKKKKMW